MSSPLITSRLYLSYALLSAYCLSGCLLEHFAVFRGWQGLVNSSGSPLGPAPSKTNNTEEKERAEKADDQQQKQQVKLLQKVNGYAVGVLYVLPKTVLTILNAYLLLNGESITSSGPTASIASSGLSLQRSLQFSATMLAVSWVQSFAVMIPLQLRIRERAEKKDVDALVRGSWVRVGSVTAHVAAALWMLYVSQFARKKIDSRSQKDI